MPAQAQQVTVAVNMNDSALRLSQLVNRASRAGRPDIGELSPEATRWLLEAATDSGLKMLWVRPEKIPDLSATSHTFWYDDPWVSSDVLITLLYRSRPGRARARSPTVGAGGGRTGRSRRTIPTGCRRCATRCGASSGAFVNLSAARENACMRCAWDVHEMCMQEIAVNPCGATRIRRGQASRRARAKAPGEQPTRRRNAVLKALANS